MPTVIACPYCHNSLSVPESAAGSVVSCPYCRQPLTVPVSEPIAAPDEAESFPHPARRYQRQPSKGKGILLAGMGVALVTVIALVGMWAATRSDPDALMLEAEYSEVCDDIDNLKRVGIDYKAEIKALESQKQFRKREFHQKYGRDPRYLHFDQRYYGRHPVR